MKIICKVVGLVFLLITISCNFNANQQVEIDYNRAESFDWDSLSRKVYHLNVTPEWFEDASGFAYKTNTREGEKYFQVAFEDSAPKEIFRIADFVKKMEEITEKEISSQEFSIHGPQWVTKNKLNFYYQSKKYTAYLDGEIRIEPVPDSSESKSSVSPDKQYEVYSEEHNLYVKNRRTGQTYPITTGGNAEYSYGSSYGWEQVMKGEGTFPESDLQINWSPDSKKFYTQIRDTRYAEKMYLLDWSIDSLYRPELLSYFRGSPGDTTVVHYIPFLYDLAQNKLTKVKSKPVPHFMDDLANYGLKWTKDGKRLLGTMNKRGYKEKDFIELDAETGEIRTVYTEKSNTNIDYLMQFELLEEKDIVFFTSEKTGWKQLYAMDWTTGENFSLTRGDFVVKQIKAIDVGNQEIYFTASGKEKEVNPYFNFLYKVNFDGSDLKLLTEEPYNHEVYLSPDYTYFVDNISSAQQPTQSVLKSTTDGKEIIKIAETDVQDLLDLNWNFPEVFQVLAKDGEAEIYGALWKPTHFDAHKKYPLVDYSYTGPHMNVFPHSFKKALYGLYNSPQALAELGFVVMQVDGRGTPGRSKAFHDKSYKNLGNNLEDHEASILELGKKYDWIDTTRVGIFGHSFGGYDAAHALLVFNDTYKVAVSESGDHDWRMEKAWYPEFYAGWPVDETYDQQSNITLAPQLKGKLFLIHGGIDENVNPSATFKLSEALIKADKEFDMFIVPSMRHAVPKQYYPYIRKKRWDFLVENLIVNPVQ